MGRMIFPFRERGRIVAKVYLGFGHYILHWEDGSKELVSDGKEACQFFYRIGEWDWEGFPKGFERFLREENE